MMHHRCQLCSVEPTLDKGFIAFWKYFIFPCHEELVLDVFKQVLPISMVLIAQFLFCGSNFFVVSEFCCLNILFEHLKKLSSFHVQEDFYAVVDWAYKIDPLRCISMHGITERYISGQKADAAGFVRILLDDLESRISMQFSRVSSCHNICFWNS